VEVKPEADSAEVKIEADCDDITLYPQDRKPLTSMFFDFFNANLSTFVYLCTTCI